MNVDAPTPNGKPVEAKASSAVPLVYTNELWSSKALNLLWLPRSDNWHNPCLLNVTSPVAGMLDDRDGRTTNAAQWFWKVNPAFGAWVCRAIKRAERAKLDINANIPGVHIVAAIVREYLEAAFPNCWEGIELASDGPVSLDSDLINDAIEFAQFDATNWTSSPPEGMPVVPKWEGWGKAKEKRDLAKGGRAGAGPGPAGGSKPGRKPDSGKTGPKLFN